MSKDEVKEAFQRIINDDYEETESDLYLANCDIAMIYRLINEHFDNPPLKFEDLTHYMWVWDNEEKMYCQIVSVLSFNEISVNYHYESLLQFKDNRFYKREVMVGNHAREVKE